MDTMQQIIQLITQVGFPVVACVYMARLYQQTITRLEDVIRQNTAVMERVEVRINDLIKN